MARTTLANVCRLIEASNAELPIEQEFLADLKRSIEMSNKKNSRKPSPTYKPSSMNCIRNMWYQVMNTDQDDGITPYTLVGICDSGSDIHIRIQTAVSLMKENDIDCEYIDVAEFVKSRGLHNLEIVSQQGMETKLYHKALNMSFLCDGIIRYKGKYYVLELKSESSNKFWARKGVDTKHYNQATAYSISFELDDVIFVYISRDSLDMKAYIFTPTDEMKQELVGTIDACDGYVQSQTIPPIPENVDKRVCEFCSYRLRCRETN